MIIPFFFIAGVMILFSLGIFPLFLNSRLVKGWAVLLLGAWIAYIAVIYGLG